MKASKLVVEEILRERVRQVKKEGWDALHDDDHDIGALAQAAACYATFPKLIFDKRGDDVWPWNDGYDKRNKHPQRRRLIIAAALLVAEIEKLDREEQP